MGFVQTSFRALCRVGLMLISRYILLLPEDINSKQASKQRHNGYKHSTTNIHNDYESFAKLSNK